MSRIGKIPVNVPKEAKVTLDNGMIHMKGPKGEMSLKIPEGINVALEDSQLKVTKSVDNKQSRANHGTIRALLVNMVTGVTKGHKKDLEIQGIGFRVQLEGKKLVFSLGFSHPVEFEIPDGVKVTVPNQTSISVEGTDRAFVGQVAAKIKALKPVEPYKGKGIRYVGEHVRRKQGKSVTK